jgi:Family of unknown function (DUF5343)
MFPYTQNVGNLIAVIKAIGSHGVPDKFTTKELPIWGFKSSNDRPIVGVLKQLGFVDGSGSPQQLWKDARTQPTVAVAQGLKARYAELFKTFPDAHRKDAESLKNFFKAKTTVGDAVVKQMVSTFQSLAQYADFESIPDSAETDATPTIHAITESKVAPLVSQIPSANGVTINLNIELVVPTDATGEVYDKFFGAMKKHLLDASK